MQLFQVMKEAYSLLTNEDVRRLARQPWQAVGVALWATRLLREDGLVPDTFVCLGQALRPVATGVANQLTLRPGLALFYDAGEGDQWLGKVKPLLLETEQGLNITTNSDATGHDRIDLVVARPVSSEGDVRSATFKTPGSAPGVGIYQKDSPHRTSWEVEFQVVEGTPAVAPAAPAAPSGWLSVCEVSRPNGQADVNAGDVTDLRTLDHLRLGSVSAWGEILVDELRTLAAGTLEFKTSDGSERAMINARPCPIAMAQFRKLAPASAPYDYAFEASFGIEKLEYLDDSSDPRVELTLSTPLQESGEAVVLAMVGRDTVGTNARGHWIGTPTLNSSTKIILHYVDTAGAVGEPPLDDYHSVVVWDPNGSAD